MKARHAGRNQTSWKLTFDVLLSTCVKLKAHRQNVAHLVSPLFIVKLLWFYRPVVRLVIVIIYYICYNILSFKM